MRRALGGSLPVCGAQCQEIAEQGPNRASSASQFGWARLGCTSLLTGKKCGIRAPFLARSLIFVGTPHRSFWMVCSCGHDRIADTLELSRVRSDRTSNMTETAKMGVGRKCRRSRSLRRHLIALATFGLTSSRRVSERQNGVCEQAKHPKFGRRRCRGGTVEWTDAYWRPSHNSPWTNGKWQIPSRNSLQPSRKLEAC